MSYLPSDDELSERLSRAVITLGAVRMSSRMVELPTLDSAVAKFLARAVQRGEPAGAELYALCLEGEALVIHCVLLFNEPRV